MKKLLKVTLSCMAVATLTAKVGVASVNCNNPEFSEPEKSDKLYHFRGKIFCEMNAGSRAVPELKHLFVSAFRNDPGFEVFSVNASGHSVLKADLSESYDSGHGKIKMFWDVLLRDDQRTRFTMEFTSRLIEAEGDARYTRHEEKSLHYHVIRSGKANFVIEKFTKVKKPALVPSSLFKAQVTKGMSKSLELMAELYAGILAGG